MGGTFNKVFARLANKPILIHTLLNFSKCSRVDKLIVVVAAHEVEIVTKLLNCFKKLKPYKVVAGGTERQYSVYNGLSAIDPATDIVLVHDAARPLITVPVIDSVIDEVIRSGAAVAAVPVTNTIKVIDNDKNVISTPDRNTLWMMQTPQGFKKELLVKAHEKAQLDNYLGTDDASLVEYLGQRVKVVMSNYDNIKITSPSDLFYAETILSKAISEKRPKLVNVLDKIKNHWERMHK